MSKIMSLLNSDGMDDTSDDESKTTAPASKTTPPPSKTALPPSKTPPPTKPQAATETKVEYMHNACIAALSIVSSMFDQSFAQITIACVSVNIFLCGWFHVMI